MVSAKQNKQIAIPQLHLSAELLQILVTPFISAKKQVHKHAGPGSNATVSDTPPMQKVFLEVSVHMRIAEFIPLAAGMVRGWLLDKQNLQV